MDKMNNINDINNITLNSNSEESSESESEDVLEKVRICFDFTKKSKQSDCFTHLPSEDEFPVINHEGLPVKMTKATYYMKTKMVLYGFTDEMSNGFDE